MSLSRESISQFATLGQSKNLGPFSVCAFPRTNTLRRVVIAWMVQVHRITPELADYHVSQMDFPELRRRMRHYVGMELSAEQPKKQSVADFYPVFGPATTTAGRSALNCIPETEARS